ncbi:hypothetical protein VNO77_28457 [Canavalia gladiata]|uniref:RING-type E3 ubiquitin transferase n=1 Tax=Canavalia gladiata TaxID=3824 RepID=A0AAN9Q4T4_CANGL
MSYFDDDHDHDHEPFGNFHDHSDFNKRILLMAIVSLSVVLVLVFALHLYARFVLKRQARRRNAIYQLSLTVAHAHAQSHQPHNAGLDPTVITALPTFLFKQEQQHGVLECAVCLNVLEDEQMVRLLPNCKHTFHVICIDTWLASHATCPICRTNAEPLRLEPHPREGPTGLALDDAPPSAPLLVEGTSDGTVNGSPKINGSNSRLSSFRRILSRERSSKRIQPSTHDDIDHDLERQSQN